MPNRVVALFPPGRGGDPARNARRELDETWRGWVRQAVPLAVLAPYGNPPLTNAQAWAAYAALLADGRVRMVDREGAGLEMAWVELAVGDSASPKLWMDAYLAAFAVTAGCTLVTTDGAFRQFRGLDVRVLT